MVNASLRQVAQWLQAEVAAGQESLDREVSMALACDLMSDVLVFSLQGSLLVTGLINVQMVRTCEVAGLAGVVVARGKRPPDETIEAARAQGLPLLLSPLSVFDACGRLHDQGLRGYSDHGPMSRP